MDATLVRTWPFDTPTLPPATQTNTYVVGSREVVLIEPAPTAVGEIAALTARLEALLAEGHGLAALLLTHHHVDHVGAAAALAARFDAPVWAHRETAVRLPSGLVTRRLEDGDRIALDGPAATELEVIFTPGHAPGHVCFFERRTGALFAGDMVAGEGTILVEPTDGDMSLYLASLARLRGLAATSLRPAHGPALSDPAAVLDRYVAHRLAREQKVLASLPSSSFVDVETAVARAYDDVAVRALPFARLSFEAHVIKLVREGRVARTSDGMLRATSKASADELG